MDTEVLRTFLEIVAQRNFGAAAEKLHVAQTTVSARIRLLEGRLGRPLFVRNKSGAVLTAAGEQLLRYAPECVQLWERARHQVALPPGRRAVLAIGGELNLWSSLLVEWLVWMRSSLPGAALRASVGASDELGAQVSQGTLDLAVVYAPRHRPGLEVELLANERLVLVTTDADAGAVERDYVYVDWGSDFALHHGSTFPGRTDPGVFVSLGPLALSYILKAGGSGYFRRSAVEPHLASGGLRLVEDAPEFSYPVYAIYGAKEASPLLPRALEGLRDISKAL